MRAWLGEPRLRRYRPPTTPPSRKVPLAAASWWPAEALQESYPGRGLQSQSQADSFPTDSGAEATKAHPEF